MVASKRSECWANHDQKARTRTAKLSIVGAGFRLNRENMGRGRACSEVECCGQRIRGRRKLWARSLRAATNGHTNTPAPRAASPLVRNPGRSLVARSIAERRRVHPADCLRQAVPLPRWTRSSLRGLLRFASNPWRSGLSALTHFGVFAPFRSVFSGPEEPRFKLVDHAPGRLRAGIFPDGLRKALVFRMRREC